MGRWGKGQITPLPQKKLKCLQKPSVIRVNLVSYFILNIIIKLQKINCLPKLKHEMTIGRDIPETRHQNVIIRKHE